MSALRRYLTESVDCNLTAAGAPTPCAEGAYVDVKSVAATNPVIVKKFSDSDPQNFSTVGAYAIRAKCGPSQTLVFEAKNVKSSNSDYEELFSDVPFGCVMP